MSRGVLTERTSVGPIVLATKTCDHCAETVPDDHLGWITVERDLTMIGQWARLDFCSIECLGVFFE